MEWKDIGKSLLGIAPTLATALGGPVGIVAGGAIKVLTEFLGLPSDAPMEAVSAELAKLSPADYVRLREVDTQYKKDILAAGVRLEEISSADRDSARRRQVDMRDWTPSILAVVILISWGLLNYFIFTHDIPSANKDFIMRTLGTVDAVVMGVVYFFYGSSAGSSRLKDILGVSK